MAYAHGQMDKRELEKIMCEFVNGEIDVLVSTTIIETGMDISNCNTMIIEDADRFDFLSFISSEEELAEVQGQRMHFCCIEEIRYLRK